jgi:hypothetical protein
MTDINTNNFISSNPCNEEIFKVSWLGCLHHSLVQSSWSRFCEFLIDFHQMSLTPVYKTSGLVFAAGIDKNLLGTFKRERTECLNMISLVRNEVAS